MFLIIYATIGIPLMAMMLMTFGEKLKHMIRSSIISFERKVLKRSRPQDIQRKSVIAVFVITAVFLCFISAISTIIENWDFSVALYVWFVTMTTIGFGDYVPQCRGTSNPILVALEYTYVVIAFFLSLTLMACIIHALSDWVNSTKPPSKDDLKQSLSCIANSLSMHKEEQPSINMALPRPFMTPLPPQALPHPYLGTM
jgi:CBS domain containing-hemolysin-like protein